jgi:type II secretory pathway component PulM
MRALTSKERRLLFALVAALFLLLNVVALKTFLGRRSALQANIAELESRLVADRAILGQKDYWTERAQWLAANQPTDDMTTVDDDNKFIDFIPSSAKQSGLSYTRREGGPVPSNGRPYAEVFDASTVKGDMKSLVDWLVKLQQPKEFRAIKQLRIKSGEPPEVVCDIEVARWFRPVEGETE